MKNIFFLIAFFLVNFFPLKACLNYYYTINKEGRIHSIGEKLLIPFNKNFNTALIVSKLEKLNAKMEQEHSYMLLSDYAVALLKLGKRKEALAIFIQLYMHYPNEYQIASNLGTAYELNGQADSALKYIKRGMELNPADHEGSEWIHVKILETKLKLASDSLWLHSHTVLELTEQQEKDSTVQKQLLLQLQERFPFSPGPDAIMASLFVDLGDAYAATSSIEYAKVSYWIAKEYYGDQSAALENKIKEMQKLIIQYRNVGLPRNIEGSDYDNEKLGSVSYKTLLDDNDKDHYQIDWSKINTDIKSLLEEMNLAFINPQTKIASDSFNEKAKEFTEPDPSTEKLPAGNKWIYILVAGLGIFAVGFIFYRLRK
jgi:tetratricopeptide (TPR) repeat protein